ncbi:MAG: outer membrane lipoprotein-sorting protein, partial [Desulfobacterales bacterium]
MKINLLTKTFWLVLLLVLLQDPRAEAFDAQSLVENSFSYMRDKSSVAEVVMTVHRPDWERKMTIKAWTRGRKDSLFYIEAPPKDHGNGTLKKGREMWMYNPK